MFRNKASGNNQLEWLMNMKVEPQLEGGLRADNGRKTSIIGTIGPKTNSREMILQLAQAGVNIVRMNFSHGSYEYHKSVIDNTRAAEKQRFDQGFMNPIAIALDTKGPEIRTGMMKEGAEIPISVGHKMTFTTDKKYAEASTDDIMYIDYPQLTKTVDEGKKIYVDDGILSFHVLEKHEDSLVVQSINSGTLSSKKGVNLPGSDVDLPALSEKDLADLKFGVENGVDMIFASFIRRSSDIVNIREALGEEGRHIKIIAKIENLQGVHNFDEIVQEADGVMVARGDLGIEIPAPRVFVAQKMMIAKCNVAGKPAICATQMLESMTYNPRPTRAEVSDVANAVLDGADCVMLSGETAKGIYPILAVEMMSETCLLAESTLSHRPFFTSLREVVPRPVRTEETIAMAAVTAADEQNASAIIVMTTSGDTARLVSKYRPLCPILSVTRNRETVRQMHLFRGCYPILYDKGRPLYDDDWQIDVDNRYRYAMRYAINAGIMARGTTVVAIQGWRAGGGSSNTIRLLRVPDEDHHLVERAYTSKMTF